MELPKVISRFIATQHTHDSESFKECFTDTAIVHDEGKTHTGKDEIQQWIAHAIKAYDSHLEALDYEQSGSNGILTANVTGTFPQSPIVLKFNFAFKEELIDSLKVTE